MSTVNTSSVKVNYRGSVGWLIFWLIIYFPVAFVLFFTAVSFDLKLRLSCPDEASTRKLDAKIVICYRFRGPPPAAPLIYP